MFGYKFIFERVWSGNVLLPKCSMIMREMNGKWYNSGYTNKHGKFTYRLKPRLIKLQHQN